VFDLRPDGNKVIIYSWAVADPGNVYALPRGRKIPLVNGLDEAAVDWFLEKFYQPYYDRYKDAFQDGARVYLVCDGTEGERSAAVTVNGAYAGGFIGAPYRIDITKSVKPGVNTLEAKPFRLTHLKIVITE